MTQSPRRLHLQILDDLRKKIQSGQIHPGDKLPPEVLLAQDWNVSRGTIRQAMQQLVNEGLLNRIPGKGTYITFPEQEITAAPRRLIGIVVPSLQDNLSAELIKGAEQSLRQAGYSLIFCHSDHELAVEETQVQQLLSQGVSGVILFPLAQPEETALVQSILQLGIPVVAIDRHIPGTAVPTILADNFGGAYAAVQHLLQLGHQRITCIINTISLSSVEQRFRGYEQAMRDANLLPYAPIPLLGASTILADTSPPVLSPAELRWVDHMLQVKERPTALFCINDFAAIGVMRHLLELGISIPDEMAVAGFDNSPFAPFAPVPLTSVAQPGAEIGARAAETLLAAVAGHPIHPATILLPTHLVIRSSTVQPTLPL